MYKIWDMWLECAGMDPTIAVPWKRLMWAWLYPKQTPVLLRLSLLKSKTYLAWKWSFRLILRDFGDHRLLTIGNDFKQAGNETSRRHILAGRESLLFGKFRRRNYQFQYHDFLTKFSVSSNFAVERFGTTLPGNFRSGKICICLLFWKFGVW